MEIIFTDFKWKKMKPHKKSPHDVRAFFDTINSNALRTGSYDALSCGHTFYVQQYVHHVS